MLLRCSRDAAEMQSRGSRDAVEMLARCSRDAGDAVEMLLICWGVARASSQLAAINRDC